MSLKKIDYTSKTADAVRVLLYQQKDGLSKFTESDYAELLSFEIENNNQPRNPDGIEIESTGSGTKQSFANLLRYLLNSNESDKSRKYDLRSYEKGKFSAFGLPIFEPSASTGYTVTDQLDLLASWEGRNGLFTVPNPQNPKQPIIVRARGIESSKVRAHEVGTGKIEYHYKKYELSVPTVLSSTPHSAQYGILLKITQTNLSDKQIKDLVAYMAAALVCASYIVRLVTSVYLLSRFLGNAVDEKKQSVLEAIFKRIQEVTGHVEGDKISKIEPSNVQLPREIGNDSYTDDQKSEASNTQLERIQYQKKVANYARFKWAKMLIKELNELKESVTLEDITYDQNYEDKMSGIEGVKIIMEKFRESGNKNLCKALATYCKNMRRHPFLTDEDFHAKLRDAYDLARSEMIDSYQKWTEEAVKKYKTDAGTPAKQDLNQPIVDLIDKQSPLGEAIVVFNAPNLQKTSSDAAEWRKFTDAPFVASDSTFNGGARKDFNLMDGRYYPERIARYMDTAVLDAKSKEVVLDSLTKAIRAALRKVDLIKEPYARFLTLRTQMAVWYVMKKANEANIDKQHKIDVADIVKESYDLTKLDGYSQKEAGDFKNIQDIFSKLNENANAEETIQKAFLPHFSRQRAEKLRRLFEFALQNRSQKTDNLDINASYKFAAECMRKLVDFYESDGAKKDEQIDVARSYDVEIQLEQIRLQNALLQQGAVSQYMKTVLDKTIELYKNNSGQYFKTENFKSLKKNVEDAASMKLADSDRKAEFVFDTISQAARGVAQTLSLLLEDATNGKNENPEDTLLQLQKKVLNLRQIGNGARASSVVLYDASNVEKVIVGVENHFALVMATKIIARLNNFIGNQSSEFADAAREWIDALVDASEKASLEKERTVFVPMYTKKNLYTILFNEDQKTDKTFYKLQETEHTRIGAVQNGTMYAIPKKMSDLENKLDKIYTEILNWEKTMDDSKAYTKENFPVNLMLQKLIENMRAMNNNHKRGIAMGLARIVFDPTQYTDNELESIADEIKEKNNEMVVDNAPTEEKVNTIFESILDSVDELKITTLEEFTDIMKKQSTKWATNAKSLRYLRRMVYSPVMTQFKIIYNGAKKLSEDVPKEATGIKKWRNTDADPTLKQMLDAVSEAFKNMNGDSDFYVDNPSLIDPSDFAEIESYIMIIVNSLRLQNREWAVRPSREHAKLIAAVRSGKGESNEDCQEGSDDDDNAKEEARLKKEMKQIELDILKTKLQGEKQKRNDQVQETQLEIQKKQAETARLQTQRELDEAKHQNDVQTQRLKAQIERDRLRDQRRLAREQREAEAAKERRAQAEAEAATRRATEREQESQKDHERALAKARELQRLKEDEHRQNMRLEKSKRQTAEAEARRRESEARLQRERDELRATEKRLQEEFELNKTREQRAFADSAHRQKLLEQRGQQRLRAQEIAAKQAEAAITKEIEAVKSEALKEAAEAKKLEAEARKIEAESKRKIAELSKDEATQKAELTLRTTQAKMRAAKVEQQLSETKARLDEAKHRRDVEERKRQEQVAEAKQENAQRALLDELAVLQEKARTAKAQARAKSISANTDALVQRLKQEADAAKEKMMLAQKDLQEARNARDVEVQREKNSGEVQKLEAQRRVEQSKQRTEAQKRATEEAKARATLQQRQLEEQIEIYKQQNRKSQAQAIAAQVAGYIIHIKASSTNVNLPGDVAAEQIEILRKLYEPSATLFSIQNYNVGQLTNDQNEQQLLREIGKASSYAIRLLSLIRQYTAQVVRDGAVVGVFVQNAARRVDQTMGPLTLVSIDASLRALLATIEPLKPSPAIAEALREDPNMMRAVEIHATAVNAANALGNLNPQVQQINPQANFIASEAGEGENSPTGSDDGSDVAEDAVALPGSNSETNQGSLRPAKDTLSAANQGGDPSETVVGQKRKAGNNLDEALNQGGGKKSRPTAETISNNLESLTDYIERLEIDDAQKENLTAKISNYVKEKTENLSFRNQELMKMADNAKKEINDLEKLKNKELETLEKLQEEKTKLQTEKETLQNTIDNQTLDLKNARIKIQELEENNGTGNALDREKMERMQTESENAKQKIEQLKKNISEKDKELNEIKEYREKLQDVISRKESEIRTLQEKIKKTEDDFTKEKKQLQQKEQQLRQQQQQKQQLRQQEQQLQPQQQQQQQLQPQQPQINEQIREEISKFILNPLTVTEENCKRYIEFLKNKDEYRSVSQFLAMRLKALQAQKNMLPMASGACAMSGIMGSTLRILKIF